MGKSAPTTTTGYLYYVSEHLVACIGPVDAFKAIKFGDKIAWTGNVTANGEIFIDHPNLFGGQDREGGVVGHIDFILGSEQETTNPFLQNILPDGGYPIPPWRGFTQLVLKDFNHGANNPNMKPITVKCSRIPCKGWYDAVAQPGTAGGVNPVHIIRELLTSPRWGLGYSEFDIDDANFRQVAAQLYGESFGLIFVWQAEATVHEFISTVINHIQASLYIDPFSGLFTLSLIRGGYNLNSLVSLDESSIVSIESFERTGIDEMVNQVTILWHDYILDQQQATTVHNPATRELQGGVVSTTIEFPGVPIASLAQKVAARELKRLSTPVAKAIFVANRKAAQLKIGDVFKFSDALHDLSNVPMRVGRIEHNSLDSNSVRIHAVEDIFSFGETLYSPPTSSLWQDPISAPAPCPFRYLMEVPYILVERGANENQTTIDGIDTQVGFVTFLGTTPAGDAYSMKLYTRISGGNYAYRAGGRFCPTALITEALVPELASTLTLTGVQFLSSVQLNTYAYIESECVEVTAVTSTTVTVNRGILDTVPVAHPANSRIWFAEDNEIPDRTQWANGATVNAKALPLTGKGLLPIASAPENSVTIVRRWLRPYPPGNLKANGVRWPSATQAAPTALTWSHRDRTLQISNYVRQDSGDFGPEAGTTYTIRVYNASNVLVRTVTGVTGTTWTYTSAMETADNPGSAIHFTIVAVRGGLESWQANAITVFR